MSTFVSLFAGVGGFDLGLERAGHTCLGQVEIDKSCQKILEKHWPSVPKHDDVQTAKEWADAEGLKGRVDIVCGGFPCQDVSVAGRRAGLAGARTGLFFDALAFASHIEAKTVILENVPGLLSSNNGRDFGVVLSSLADAGYSNIEWRVLNSQFFGVPQRRRRIFIVASAPGERGFQVLAEQEGSGGDSEESREAREDLARALAKRTVESGELVGTLQARDYKGVGNQYVNENKLVVARMQAFGQYEMDNTASALKARDYKDATDLVVSTFRKSKRAQTNTDDESWVLDEYANTVNVFDVGDTRATELIVETIPVQSTIIGRSDTAGPQGPGYGTTEDPMYTIDTVGPHGVAMGFMHNAGIDIQASEELTPTIKAGHDTMPSVMTRSIVRRLTPVECERLQGFPDDWTAGQADSARYKQMGNAVTVNVIEWIGKRL